MINWFEKHHKISFIILAIVGITIFYVSSLSFPPSLESDPLKPLLYHFFAFFFFALFLFIFSIRGKNRNLFALAITISFIYAVIDELHQSFVPFRDASISDIFTDTTGILFAFIIYSILLVYRGKNHSI